MLTGIYYPKMVEIRENPGRPARTFRADRPDTSTYMSPINLLEQCDTFIRFQNKANISYPIGGPRRHKVQPKDPHVSAKIVKWGNIDGLQQIRP